MSAPAGLPVVSQAAPALAAGDEATFPSLGRNNTQWVPGTAHTSASVSPAAT
ncbi:hypothetical protein [Streptomyces sp. NPDC086787]|uniref:hypothetical protein n=1 Tax=Streptomyces sp. NPDC086787 TaxID=3365759 RepID=UPI00381724FB